ncbi:NrsF family protein [Bradyrhizobium sp. AZCC 1693]|uniref:NrsF family protein n=1 Tax=Bradyrhizobium sp. AZCC 1693 TaxID=3117029 RepID=UPI002FF1E7B3
MRTDQLIESLAADLKPVDRSSVSRALLIALAIGAAAALSVMFVVFGSVPNFLSRAHPDVFVTKLLFGVGVAATAAALLPKAARPRTDIRNAPALIFLPFTAIVAAAASALASVRVTEWSDMIFEEHSVTCFLTIPLLAIPAFMALVCALRFGAPTDQSFAAVLRTVAGAVFLGCCAGDHGLAAASHRRETVTDRYLLPNSSLKRAHDAFSVNDGAGTMLKKSLLTISFLLPLAALSATAQAGSTITDKSYWPNEARRSAQYPGFAQDRVSSAFAFDRGAPTWLPATGVNQDRSPWRYQGGPKSR